MRRTTRITTLVLLVFFILAGLGVLLASSAGAAVVSGGGVGGAAKQGKVAARDGLWSVRIVKAATRDLGPVPKVVHSTTKKHPPKNVKFNGEPVPGGITTGTSTATPGAGEVVVPGVPGYSWRDGCGPTAVGMVVGYYDGNGWGDLIPGDATGVTADVNQAIASHGSAEAPGNYEDYAQPIESGNTPLADKSAPPAGDEHASNSVADFMHTSWSSDGLLYGWSYSNMVGSAFVNFVKTKYPDATTSSATYSGSNLTWTRVKQEVDAGRPMVFLVDSSGDGMTDHFVTVVGYRETNGYPEYACWDTWSTTLLRWQQFRAMSSSYAWGVWGGFTLSVSGSVTPPPPPTPTPTPTPTVTPTPTPTTTPSMPPAPTEDLTAPVTTQTGVDAAWHSSSVKVAFSATDVGSGVAYTEYSLDGGAWTRGTSVTIAAPRKSATAVVHTLQYRSADNWGNVEAANFAQVKIDTVKPVTTSNADGVTHSGSFTVVLTARDSDAGVAATYYSVDSRTYKVGTSVVVSGAGRHTVRFYSVDNAGNKESTESVTVRIS